MTDRRRIVVTVAADGTVSAETKGILGADCLDYIAVLEELLDARVVQSAYTADHDRTTTYVSDRQELRDVDRA
ncbi:DUF2997 domain-containing protein [Plantactinospora sonchi]|uniref:DUF2997 domain-containing protein n=1 Tax=Plantactinospora sonchi TaxID=1544735 RepID=A0ABU7RKI1_9ACTN